MTLKNSPSTSENSASLARATNPPCAGCGGSNVSTSIETDHFIYGSGSNAVELSAHVPVRTCVDCGTQFTDEAAERLRHDAVCQHLDVLTPTEIRAIRISYGYNRPAFASLTRLGEATLARWESGATIQNAAYDKYLRLLRDPAIMSRLTGLTAVAPAKLFPTNVVPFTPRLRAISHVSHELVHAQAGFRLHR